VVPVSGGENPPTAPERGHAYLTVAAEHRGDAVVVRLRGELDVSSVDGLRQAMHGILKSLPQTVVVDVSGLGFADCAGLSVLSSARRRLAEQGRKLIITDPQPLVQRLLTLTGLNALQGGRDDG
jgi:anti-anti-sigma factor